MLKIVPVVALGLLLATSAQAAQDDDFLIVPGQGAGSITKDASEASLRAVFGAGRVMPQAVWIGEGFACQGSRIFFDDGDSLNVTWLDPEAKLGAVSVQVNGQRWKTKEGVRLGMSLKEPERINGKPFDLLGFGWDHGGGLMSWEGGHLQAVMPRKTRAQVRLHFGPDRQDYESVTPEERGQVPGDKDVSSAYPVMRKLNPRLRVLSVHFDQEKDCESFFCCGIDRQEILLQR